MRPAIVARCLAGPGGGVDFCHTTITDHKKLFMSGFLRCSRPNGPAPDLGTLRAMCHLLRSCWAETTLLNKSPHSDGERGRVHGQFEPFFTSLRA